jgi:indolepyruvate ferredoxin oxidoreductase
MTLMQVGLDDKYRLEAKRIYLSGVQALVRLPMLQRERERRCYGASACRV